MFKKKKGFLRKSQLTLFLSKQNHPIPDTRGPFGPPNAKEGINGNSLFVLIGVHLDPLTTKK